MKPRVRLESLPARIAKTGAVREARSTAWGALPRTGDATIYLGNRHEKLVVHTHTVLLMRHFPTFGKGFDPVVESLIR